MDPGETRRSRRSPWTAPLSLSAEPVATRMAFSSESLAAGISRTPPFRAPFGCLAPRPQTSDEVRAASSMPHGRDSFISSRTRVGRRCNKVSGKPPLFRFRSGKVWKSPEKLEALVDSQRRRSRERGPRVLPRGHTEDVHASNARGGRSTRATISEIRQRAHETGVISPVEHSSQRC